MRKTRLHYEHDEMKCKNLSDKFPSLKGKIIVHGNPEYLYAQFLKNNKK